MTNEKIPEWYSWTLNADNMMKFMNVWIRLMRRPDNIFSPTRLYFRGESSLPNYNLPLQPSLVRNTPTNHNLFSKWDGISYDEAAKNFTSYTNKDFLRLENKLLQRFKRYTAHQIQSRGEFAGRQLSNLEILCLAQHHGLPTLLLDWSMNIFVSLYFALTDADGGISEKCSRIWVMGLKNTNDREEQTVHLEECNCSRICA